ncbi:MAG: hypothetical protein AAGF97_20140 [Planctomycetota bacterium]
MTDENGSTPLMEAETESESENQTVEVVYVQLYRVVDVPDLECDYLAAPVQWIPGDMSKSKPSHKVFISNTGDYAIEGKKPILEIVGSRGFSLNEKLQFYGLCVVEQDDKVITKVKGEVAV